MNRIVDAVPDQRSLYINDLGSTRETRRLPISTVVDYFLSWFDQGSAGGNGDRDVLEIDFRDPAMQLLLDSWWIPQTGVLLVPRIAIHEGSSGSLPLARVNANLPHWPRLATRICDLANQLDGIK